MKKSILETTDILLNELYKNKGLDSIVDLASELIGCPICIIGINQKIFSHSRESGFAGTYMNSFIENGYISDEEQQGMINGKLMDRLYFESSPFSTVRKANNLRVLHSPIRLNGTLFAHIAVYGFHHDFTEEDSEYLTLFAKIFTLELQKSHIFQGDALPVKASQLNDLLFSKREITHYSIRGWNHKRYTNLMFIGRESNTRDYEKKFHNLWSYLRRAAASDIVTQNDDGIILLLTDYEPLSSGHEKYDRLEDLLRSYGFYAGISNDINNMKNIRNFYEEAREAFKINRLFNRGTRITSYSNAAFFICLSLADRIKSVKSFTYPPIIQLKKYDNEKNTDYYQTLKVYLECSKNPAQASEQLNIHKNTLFYRINKIKEIMNVDLDKSTDLFNILMSIYIDNYLTASEKKRE